jgi:hypothetical protein
MNIIKPLPALPTDFGGQPSVVSALDDIRFTIEEEERAEFAWFAREYPRIFRYHLYHAEHRLEAIHKNYATVVEGFEKQIASSDQNFFGVSTGRGVAWQIYWDFEAFLNVVASSLDVLARIVGVFYVEQTPISFNKLCAKRDLDGPVDLLRKAKDQWVNRLKDYRDCFVHYTPVDNESYVHCHRYPDGWEVRCQIPTNPNARETDGFRFSRRIELLRYAISVYEKLRLLDRRLGRSIREAWQQRTFPKRVDNLFFIGARHRQPPNQRLQPTATGGIPSRRG